MSDDSVDECICVSICSHVISAFEDSVYRNFPYVFCYVSVPLGLCMPPVVPILTSCLHAYIWQYTHVFSNCVFAHVLALPVWVHSLVCVQDMHACAPTCLCVFQYICGSPCPFVHSRGMCRLALVSKPLCIYMGAELRISLSLLACLCSESEILHECDFVCSSCASKWVCVWCRRICPWHLCVGLSGSVCPGRCICRYKLPCIWTQSPLSSCLILPLYLYIMLISLYIKAHVSVCIDTVFVYICM